LKMLLGVFRKSIMGLATSFTCWEFHLLLWQNNWTGIFLCFEHHDNVCMICNSQQCRWRTEFLSMLNFSHEVFFSVVLFLYTALSRTSFGNHFLLVACTVCYCIKRLRIKSVVVCVCMYGVFVRSKYTVKGIYNN